LPSKERDVRRIAMGSRGGGFHPLAHARYCF
jgi:hypothetical protein